MSLIPQAQAQTQDWSAISKGCVVGDVATIQGVGCLVANVLSVALTIIGLAGFVMIIYAAFYMMLMGSNSQGTEKAKNTITMAVVGLIVALSSFIILNIISAFTGVSLVENISIPGSGRDWGAVAPSCPEGSLYNAASNSCCLINSPDRCVPAP